MHYSNNILPVIQQNEVLWDLYTRKEEYTPWKLDQYGRFLHSYSTNQEVRVPLVSRHLIDNGYNFEFPDQMKFAVCLTHDVDEIYPPNSHTLLSLLTCVKNRDPNSFKDQITWRMHGKKESPYRNFQKIMDIEEGVGARSSFFFLATDADIRRFRYDIEDLEEDLGRIVDRGWEVGLHGGYYAYNNLGEIQREKDRLERVLGRDVIGYRNHYLRFSIPNTWKDLEKAGFKYDSTLGYPDAVGFRNGMCHPFQPVDLNNKDQILDILEIPLVIMDGTLFDSVKSYAEAWSMTKEVIDTVESCQGVLTINWHSNNFSCSFRESWIRLYESILKYCQIKNAWMVSGEEIQRWWTTVKPTIY